MMLPGERQGFTLDARLETESEHVTWLGLCELRIRDDRRWPWLLLIPLRKDVEELHELKPLDQAMLSFETNLVSQTLKDFTGCTKINCASLGNIVRQLHVHIIARREGDAGWPGPVWGYGNREPYRRDALHQLVEDIRQRL